MSTALQSLYNKRVSKQVRMEQNPDNSMVPLVFCFVISLTRNRQTHIDPCIKVYQKICYEGFRLFRYKKIEYS